MLSAKLVETPIGLAYDRLLEVALGLLVAVTVSFLVLPAPAHTLGLASAARAQLESANKTLDASIANRLKGAKQQFGMAAAALDAMSPLRVLERGYAIAQNTQGQAVREASTMAAGDEIRLRLWKGSLDCRVEGTNVK
jgi:exonuclease VII large subunit